MPFFMQVRRQAAGTVILALVAAWFLMCRTPAEAWSYHTHRKIVSDALSFMPQEFQNRFRPFKEAILKGATDPDTVLKDFMNHVYHVHSRTGHESAIRIRDLFLQAIESLKQRRPDEEVAYTLGLLGHYVADINQPLHTAGAEGGDAAESEYHGKFEKDVQSRMTKIPVPIPTAYTPVVDPAGRVREMAEAASKYYTSIGTAYHTGRGLYDVENVVNEQYAAAVKNLADFWLGIAIQGGMTVNLVPPPLQAGGSVVDRQANVLSASPSLLLNQTLEAPISKAAALDLNTATKEQLMNIPGIGEKRADAILEARRIQLFKSVRDLANVTFPASGKKAFHVSLIDRLSDLLTVK